MIKLPQHKAALRWNSPHLHFFLTLFEERLNAIPQTYPLRTELHQFYAQDNSKPFTQYINAGSPQDLRVLCLRAETLDDYILIVCSSDFTFPLVVEASSTHYATAILSLVVTSDLPEPIQAMADEWFLKTDELTELIASSEMVVHKEKLLAMVLDPSKN